MRTKLFAFMTVLIFLLSACQKPPEQPVVISKNDGSFDANVIVSATDHHEQGETQPVAYDDCFFSTDGTVKFNIAIDNAISTADMPVLEVVPHFLTSEEIQNVATALFGDRDFYEMEPPLSENFSKEEILQKINRWSKFTTTGALVELLGYQPDDDYIQIIKSFISEYTQKYENAPEENPHTPAQWTFRKSGEYLFLPEEWDNIDMSKDNDEISIQLSVGDIPYSLTATNRNQSDFKVNMISAGIDAGISPNRLDDEYFIINLCRTEAPTEAQLKDIQNKAETIISNMKLGNWQIDRCYVENIEHDNSVEYIVHVDAVPELNGIPAIRREQLENIRDDSQYASNYYYTDINFEFSANGDLIQFMLFSPLDIYQTINDNVAVLPLDTLLEYAKSNLSLSDYYNYGFGMFIDQIDEPLSCNVELQKLNFNLLRVKVPDTDDHYYYVPGIILQGRTQYIGQNSGELYYESDELENYIALNAIDGSVIHLLT